MGFKWTPNLKKKEKKIFNFFQTIWNKILNTLTQQEIEKCIVAQ